MICLQNVQHWMEAWGEARDCEWGGVARANPLAHQGAQGIGQVKHNQDWNTQSPRIGGLWGL